MSTPAAVASSVRPIEDYALIGDCRAAALVSSDGSIDWLCAPRFDSAALFAALLDPRVGGSFHVRAAHTIASSRSYVGDTNVLETRFVAPDGRLTVTDFMPVASQRDKQRLLLPDSELVRAIECTDGEVEVDVHCEPRPSYGAEALVFESRGPLGFFADRRGRVYVIRTDAPLSLRADRCALEGRFTLRRGERRYITFSTDHGHPAVLPSLGTTMDARLERSIAWWQAWADRSTYDGPYRGHVVRSALVLKLLSYAPSGAIVAAPTTSLPEWIGGTRNWDYRYCWLRDASMTLRALFGLGHELEGQAFLSWLLHATRQTWPDLRILYDVYGEHRVAERELPHLSGYAGSRPVRVGNAAVHQLQLDVYGEVVDAVARFVRIGGRLDRATGRMLAGLGRAVCRRWREPDEGIWEPRSGPRQHTLSQAMCWVALDRLIALHEGGHLHAPVDEFRRVREEIRREVETRGYDEATGSYAGTLGGHDVDASLLLLGLYGFEPPDSPRMMGTSARIYRELGRGALLYRYLDHDDGLPPGEGAFGIAGFWGVQCRALAGDRAGAREAFERLCEYGNDVGLFAEEYDPDTGAALGNYPQAFTHVGLINAAITLAACERGHRPEAEIEQRRAMSEEHV